VRKMYKSLIILLLLFLSSISYAELNSFKQVGIPGSGSTGLGLTLGQPSGLTLKHWLSSSKALDFRIGEGNVGSIALQGDYVTTFHSFKSKDVFLPLYIGGGLGVGFGDAHNRKYHYYRYDGPGFTLRMPVGITCIFLRAPFDAFLELTPHLLFAHDHAHFGFAWSIGGRYYF